MYEPGHASIIGIGELKTSLDAGSKCSLDLLAEAAALAILDAGLQIGDVDGQLRGEAGGRQVKNNRLALVNGNGGVMSTQCCLILGRA
jgi:hypothetical protein